jgi:protein-S-isoprenylcysteine O-methyltransferase Ste14
MDLNRKAWLALIILAVAMSLLIFFPAGTARCWQAWVFLLIYFGGSVLITLYLMKKNPALLARRMRGGPTAEKEKAEKVIMSFTSLGFIGILVVSGLDRRFGWSQVPLPITVLGDLLEAGAWVVFFIVFRENSYSAATIEVQEGQRVISTGPYAVVRHPMYAGGALLVLGMPLALGSYWALLACASMLPFLLWRILDEERLLSRNLPGYKEYCAKVRWRMIPWIF